MFNKSMKVYQIEKMFKRNSVASYQYGSCENIKKSAQHL